ncbi:hypothetical protein [Prochlorococcus marinus]|uniref:Uncharacterized protein n=1 Tax=Prochlorococcus marinus (strain MIT 9211) TaxID=93059 RepID=A9BAX0_PROM4|nr:hypothetical protein [Prochlorococcus marinus]ABX08982.1 conserved hypothetical protein [Prochlorococcus marinus str. MIT 9211]
MSDSYGDPQQNQRNFDSRNGGFRGGRNSGPREGGGFRIRLSDNEMKAARALQEAFNLRSTVAVLGFALRTLGQMLEEGKLNDLITQQHAQGHRNTSHSSKSGMTGQNRDFQGGNRSNNKPNPFARPEKPSSPEASTNNNPLTEDKEGIALNNKETDSDNETPETESELETKKETTKDKVISDESVTSESKG